LQVLSVQKGSGYCSADKEKGNSHNPVSQSGVALGDPARLPTTEDRKQLDSQAAYAPEGEIPRVYYHGSLTPGTVPLAWRFLVHTRRLIRQEQADLFQCP
jgi:hypothetical protein